MHAHVASTCEREASSGNLATEAAERVVSKPCANNAHGGLSHARNCIPIFICISLCTFEALSGPQVSDPIVASIQCGLKTTISIFHYCPTFSEGEWKCRKNLSEAPPRRRTSASSSAGQRGDTFSKNKCGEDGARGVDLNRAPSG